MFQDILKKTGNLFPIKRNQLAKFLLISFFIFCTLFIQNIARLTKDSLVNTLVGTEVIVFLKSFVVLPVSIIFSIFYIKILNNFKAETIFIVIISVFITFFTIFGLLIFPYYEHLHLSDEVQELWIKKFPHLKWFIMLLSSWSFSLFYLFAELWPNIVLALLVWQLVNTISTVKESKKFYPLFGIISQSNLIISGSFFTKIRDFLPSLVDANQFLMKTVSFVILFLGIILIIMFKILNYKYLLKKDINLSMQKMDKFSLKEIFFLVRQHKYIGYIILILICYGLSINLIEVPWKSVMSERYRTPLDFGENYGRYMQITGIVTITMVIASYIVIDKLGWYVAALFTPIIMLTFGVVFFTSYLIRNSNLYIDVAFFAFQNVNFVIIVGALQNISTKSAKYSFFDTTKEMSYVPLDSQLKTRGKAIADVTGVKLGKSLSSLLQAILFIAFPYSTYQTNSFFLMLLFIFAILIWMCAVSKLNIEYKKITQNQ